jgi:hydroxymethylglutaryl-CoA reductase (NADPH)
MSKLKAVSPDAASMREDTIRALVDGSKRFHEIPAHYRATEAAAIRREALERLSGVKLDAIGHHSFDTNLAAKRNCENMIGVAQVPMGIVGPLTVHGEHIDGDVWVPMATTEGALLASINRGCTAIRQAGGAAVHVDDVGMTRAPVFRTESHRETREFLAWIQDHEDDIRSVASGTSRFLKLTEVRPFTFGTTIFLRFRFTTGDAMGMNMATIACDRIVRDLIEPKTGIPCVALSGNYCVDKKAASVNFNEGRGKRIHAEVVLDAAVLRDTLKTDAASLIEVQYRKNLLGSIASGSMGYNAHFANVLSAVFLATGQDPAHVVGGSTGVTCMEPRPNGSVYASIFIPDAPLGAIGGGMSLNTQSEALRILGVVPDPERPGHAAMRLAEIVGAAVLAGELSLMAAFTSSDLARAHERLGRGGSPGGEQDS